MYLSSPRWRATMRYFLLFALTISTSLLISQENTHQLSHGDFVVRAGNYNSGTVVGPPEGFVPGQDRAATMIVNYTGFTTDAQTAFQYAVDIWASLINSPVTIYIDANFAALDPGILGSAGASTIHRNFTGAPETDTWYPQALANSLAGTDLSDQSDINANFSSTANWYYGLDANPGVDQYDFVSVVMHEIGHGLGFFGSATVSSGLGYTGQSGSPYIYDTFVQNGSGTSILSYTSGSTSLADQLQGNNLYWNGPLGNAGNEGSNPRLYAPFTWIGGSSFSHLNETTFGAGNMNSLMTPEIGSGEAIHSPGPAALGMYEDMGWSLDGSAGCPSCAGNCVTITMSDSFGDGWNGANYNILNSEGIPVASGTLASGSTGQEFFCITNGCYTIQVGGGIFDGEISWTLTGIDGALAGGATTSMAFGVGGTNCSGCTDSSACNYVEWAASDDGNCCYATCVSFEMTDGFGDGWNGAMYEVREYASGSLVANGTLDGTFGTDILCLDDGCYLLSVGGGSFDAEIGWTLSGAFSGNQSGGAPVGDISFNVGDVECLGCILETACNFVPGANTDDGSCCFSNCVTFDMTDGFGDGWNGNVYSIFDENGNIVASGTLENGTSGQKIECLGDGCYFMTVDSGTFQSEIGWTITGADGGPLSGGAPYEGNFSINSDCQGCTDDLACNYSNVWTDDDGSCCFENCITFDMLDGFGDGWNGNVYNVFDENGDLVASGTLDTGTEGQNLECLEDGCYYMTVDSGSFQSEIDWTITGVDGGSISGGAPYSGHFSINSVCEGCTDSGACNYNIVWPVDDGSCCYANCLSMEMFDTFGDGWNGATYVVSDSDGNQVASGTLEDGLTGQTNVCVTDGCYSITVEGGVFDSEINWTLNGVDGGSLSGNAPGTWAFSVNSVCLGCTDIAACNFDPTAGVDDGSCEFSSCSCLGDFNGDMNRDTTDLLTLLANFGCDSDCTADLTGDDNTDTQDLLAFLSIFGTPCP